MGRHELARKRRITPVALAVLAAPAALFFAVGGDVNPATARSHVKPVLADAESSCCIQLAAAASAVLRREVLIARSSKVSDASITGMWDTEAHVPAPTIPIPILCILLLEPGGDGCGLVPVDRQ